METRFQRYCKRNQYSFTPYEDIAEAAHNTATETKNAMRMVHFRSVMDWIAPEQIKVAALTELTEDTPNWITKSKAIKEYGGAFVDRCPWFLTTTNPYYRTSPPMRLYFRSVLDLLKSTNPLIK